MKDFSSINYHYFLYIGHRSHHTPISCFCFPNDCLATANPSSRRQNLPCFRSHGCHQLCLSLSSSERPRKLRTSQRCHSFLCVSNSKVRWECHHQNVGSWKSPSNDFTYLGMVFGIEWSLVWSLLSSTDHFKRMDWGHFLVLHTNVFGCNLSHSIHYLDTLVNT